MRRRRRSRRRVAATVAARLAAQGKQSSSTRGIFHANQYPTKVINDSSTVASSYTDVCPPLPATPRPSACTRQEGSTTVSKDDDHERNPWILPRGPLSFCSATVNHRVALPSPSNERQLPASSNPNFDLLAYGTNIENRLIDGRWLMNPTGGAM